MFGLTDRMVAKCFEGKKFVGTDIDYEPINKKRLEYKKLSSDFILGALRDVEEKRKNMDA